MYKIKKKFYFNKIKILLSLIYYHISMRKVNKEKL